MHQSWIQVGIELHLNCIRVKFTERDGSVNGTLWPKTRILKGVGHFFHFPSFTIRKGSLCRCMSIEVCPLNQELAVQIFPFNCIFTRVSISLFHEIRNGAYEISFQIYCDLKFVFISKSSLDFMYLEGIMHLWFG